MRRKEPVTDKNWRPGALEVREVAASLDRIYKKVNAKGFTEEAAGELQEDLRLVRERFAIGERAARTSWRPSSSSTRPTPSSPSALRTRRTAWTR